MGKTQELKTLPSVMEMPDGDGLLVRELTEAEREQCLLRMAENLEKRMGYYYMQHPEEKGRPKK